MSVSKHRKTNVKHNLTPKETLHVIGSYMARSARLWYRFKISFIFMFISMIVAITIWYFMNKVLEINIVEDYFTFVLVGVIINQYVLITLSIYLESLKELYWSNQLEFYLTSPSRLKTFFFASLTWTYIYATINAVLYLVIGIFIFDAKLVFRFETIMIIPILFLLITALSGIGLISASMFMLVDAKGEIEPVSWTVTTITLLVSGVVFPYKAFLVHFPPLYYVAISLPQTWAIDGIRGVFEGKGIGDTIPIMGILALFAFVLFPLGVAMFRLGIKRGEKIGTLAKWA